MKRTLVVIMILMVSAGCTRLSSENLALVDRSVTFDQVLAAPQSFIGKTVVFGGVIATIAKEPQGVVLEVIERDLDRDLIPKEAATSPGRFLATTPIEADITDLQPGNMVTLIGEVKGRKTRRIEDSPEYTFPVVAIREIRKWNTSENGPSTRESDYDPYYSGYPGDPYKNRPIGPVLKKY